MRPLFVIQLRAPRASLKVKSYALTHSRQRGAHFIILSVTDTRTPELVCSQRLCHSHVWQTDQANFRLLNLVNS
jgi:hypothetical protein